MKMMMIVERVVWEINVDGCGGNGE